MVKTSDGMAEEERGVFCRVFQASLVNEEELRDKMGLVERAGNLDCCNTKGYKEWIDCEEEEEDDDEEEDFFNK